MQNMLAIETRFSGRQKKGSQASLKEGTFPCSFFLNFLPKLKFNLEMRSHKRKSSSHLNLLTLRKRGCRETKRGRRGRESSTLSTENQIRVKGKREETERKRKRGALFLPSFPPPFPYLLSTAVRNYPDRRASETFFLFPPFPGHLTFEV